MKEIHYFGRRVDPSIYRNGFGFWGWLINILNTVRMWLEKQTVLTILRIEARRAGLHPKEVRDIVRQAAKHSDFVPKLEESGLPRFVRKLLRDDYPVYNQTTEDRQRARYSEGRKNGNERPAAFEDGMARTFSQYQSKFDRSARYVSGRKDFNDYGETNIETVPRRRRRRMNEEQKPGQFIEGDPPVPAPAPVEQVSQEELRRRSLAADFALGQQTKHLRLANGLPKPGRR